MTDTNLNFINHCKSLDRQQIEGLLHQFKNDPAFLGMLLRIVCERGNLGGVILFIENGADLETHQPLTVDCPVIYRSI